jgi:hypothetical protein
MAIPVILKGDTSATIRLSVADGDYTGSSLEVSFFGVTREFTDIKGGETIAIEWTADETAFFPLGTWPLTMKVKRGENVRTLPFAKVKVTDAPGEVYDAAIKIAPILDDLKELTEADTQKDVKSALNTILKRLKNAATCLLIVAIPLLSMAAITTDTKLDDIPGLTTISNIVTAAGVPLKSDLPPLITNVVREIKGTVYDKELGITWKQVMYDGNLYYIAVTNANITEVK